MRARIVLVSFLFPSIFNLIASGSGLYKTLHIGGGGGGGISTRLVFRQGQLKDKVSTDLERLEDRPTRRTVGPYPADGPAFLGMRLPVLQHLRKRCRQNIGPNKKTESTQLSRIISDQKSEGEQEEEEGSAFVMSPEAEVGATTQWQSGSDYDSRATMVRQLAQYKSWRNENGYGRQNSRWGRSQGRRLHLINRWKRWSEGRKGSRETWKNIHQPGLPSYARRPLVSGGEEGDPDEKTVDVQRLARSSAAYKMTFSRTPGEESGRWKRDLFPRRRLRTLGDLKFPPKMKEALEDYRTWRSRNGYGKLAGRWG